MEIGRSSKEELCSSSSGESDYDEDTNEENMEIACQDLFSSATFLSPDSCLKHLKTTHGFDLEMLKERHSLDTFSYIKLINYIRKEKPSPGLVMSLSSDNLWNSAEMGDKYLEPTLANDGLLMYDIEDIPLENQSHLDDASFLEGQFYLAKEPSSDPGELQKDYEKMRRVLADLSSKLTSKDQEMYNLLQDLNQIRETAKKIVDVSSTESDQFPNMNEEAISVSSRIKESEDQNYANSYSHFGIHHEMLSDKVRTEGYKDAIEGNSESTIKDKSVLDLGCGTGILSMFCCRAGAKSVTAVDMSEIIHHATDIAIENGYYDKIKFHKGRFENLQDLKQNSFDVIVSEWMGYFLLFEGMLDSVIDARDKYLNPNGGRLLPNRTVLYLTALHDEVRYKETIGFWDDVYGFKMSCLRKPVLTEASVEIVHSDKVVAKSPAQILDLDLEKCTVKDYSSFSSDFELEIKTACKVTAIVGYFDTFFDLPDKSTMFTTGPFGEPTHWKQTVFYLKKVIDIKEAGEIIVGNIRVSRPPSFTRGLVVHLTVNGNYQKYSLE